MPSEVLSSVVHLNILVHQLPVSFAWVWGLPLDHARERGVQPPPRLGNGRQILRFGDTADFQGHMSTRIVGPTFADNV